MAAISINDAVEQVLAVIREAFEGVDRWSYFLDHGAQFGLLGTLRSLDAATASRLSGGKSSIYGAAASGPSQASIAAHAQHVIFGLEVFTNWIKGIRTNYDWDLSWAVSDVDDQAWAALLDRLQASYAELKRAIEEHGARSVESMGGGVGAIAHTAYHLGRIQEKLDSLG